MTRLFLAAVLPGLLAGPVHGQTTRISGTLAGSDGSPIPVSHVHVQGWADQEILASAAVDPDGSWSLALDTTGVFLAWFSGIGHQGERVGLLIRGDEDLLELDVRLARQRIRDRPVEATLIGDFNGFAKDRGRLPLHRREDGTLTVDVATEADTLAYQFLGVAWTSPVEDPRAPRYVYDGAGGYRSVVDVVGPFATIEFDPAGLMPGADVPGSGGAVRFADPASPAGRFGAYSRELFGRVDAYFERRAREAASGATVSEMRDVYESYDPAPDAAMVGSALAKEPEPAVRDLILVTYFGAPIKTDPKLAADALEQIPPASEAWRVQPSGLPKGLSATGNPNRSRDYALAVLRRPASGEDRSDELRIAALAWLLEDALARASTDELEAYHAWLIGEYPASAAAAKAAALYAPNRRIQPGQPIPEFEVRSMEDSIVTYSRADLAGRIVMLDFWATWCGPCITEMPYMHQAFEKYSVDGFTILSLSFDLASEDVERFRSEGDWPMPWLHAYIERGQESEFAASMDVVNIPRAILIGRDGTILATNESLRGERLDETLTRVIEDEN